MKLTEIFGFVSSLDDESGILSAQTTIHKNIHFQALCQVISYDAIHDRRWLFDNFLPRFSQMLKDPTMHVRKVGDVRIALIWMTGI